MGSTGNTVLWILACADAVGRPTMRELRTWSLPDIVDALVVVEAIGEQARYARIADEHRRAAEAARGR